MGNVQVGDKLAFTEDCRVLCWVNGMVLAEDRTNGGLFICSPHDAHLLERPRGY